MPVDTDESDADESDTDESNTDGWDSNESDTDESDADESDTDGWDSEQSSASSTNVSPSVPLSELKVGLSVAKNFGGKMYDGVITRRYTNKGKTLWHVKYEDSDSEDVSDVECGTMVWQHRHPAPTGK